MIVNPGPTVPSRLRPPCGDAGTETTTPAATNAASTRMPRIMMLPFCSLVRPCPALRARRANGLRPRQSLKDGQRREDDVERDQRQALERERLAVPRHLPDRERGQR